MTSLLRNLNRHYKTIVYMKRKWVTPFSQEVFDFVPGLQNYWLCKCVNTIHMMFKVAVAFRVFPRSFGYFHLLCPSSFFTYIHHTSCRFFVWFWGGIWALGFLWNIHVYHGLYSTRTIPASKTFRMKNDVVRFTRWYIYFKGTC